MGLSPPLIAVDPELVNDTAPEGRWKYNLLQQDREAKFREVVAKVKALAQAIGRKSCPQISGSLDLLPDA